ncbi:ArdC family protein [Sphingomonas sp. SUN039]|uniref:ArdC family protein n=1 Tax=Sphingomonas sp. SUN039 TaxID=2937787 RepID=UPI0021643FB4|nr:zincin-like metallopeptidase domain-containing protein [Sphingomonas sp. SUN039]UVO53733.1 zincin-like metallopeptidase domain-containing protein [Sphingomonas sp. SUN039]
MRPKPRQRDIAAEITALIIARIEAGTLPWRRPWTSGSGGRPLRHCGTPYTGINTLYLWAVADALGYKSPTWMTYKQASELGGQVRRHEKGSISVYYSSFTRDDSASDAAPGDTRTIRFLRAYTVFNVDQIDGLPARFYPGDAPPPALTASARQAAIDAFFANIPARVSYGGSEAYYDRIADSINIPNPDSFVSADHLASTLAHEHVHWSGHADRLARTFGKKFGDDAYAREELVAELGSGLICADLGLPNDLHDSHANYIGHWLRVLRANKAAIIQAASKAEQAYQFLKAFGEAGSATEATDHKAGAEA